MRTLWIVTLAVVLLASSGFSAEEGKKQEGKKELFEDKTAKEIVEVIKERREAKYQEMKAEMEERHNKAMAELKELGEKEDLTKEDVKAFVKKSIEGKKGHKGNRKRQGKRHQEKKQEGKE